MPTPERCKYCNRELIVSLVMPRSGVFKRMKKLRVCPYCDKLESVRNVA